MHIAHPSWVGYGSVILYTIVMRRHQMETVSASLALCAGTSPVTGESPAQRPVTRSFDVFFDLRLNKRLSKQSWGWWFETPSRSLWRHCNGVVFAHLITSVQNKMLCLVNKANLRDLIAATGLVILLKLDPNHHFFSPCDLEIWWMTSKNNRAPLLYYIKLCASFQIHQWIQTEVTARKRSIRVKICDFLSGVTSKFDGWPWKTIWHIFYTTSSFVHHFKAMGKFKLELQSRNAQFGSKSAIFLSRVTFKFDGWPWKTTGRLFYAASDFAHHFIAINEFKLELQSGNAQFGSKSTIFWLCDLEIWRMTLKNIRAPLLCYFTLVNSNWSYSPEMPNLGQNRRFY